MGQTESSLPIVRDGVVLNASDHRFTSDDVTKLAEYINENSITTLILHRCDINDSRFERIATMTDLEVLDSSHNLISAGNVFGLSKLRNLKTLDLSNNNVNDKGAIALSNLRNLEKLGLSNNYVDDEGATALSTMPNLTTLNLYNNYVGDEGAIAISTMKNLKTLDLFHNFVGNEGAIALSKLEKLERLYLVNDDKITEWDSLITAFESHPTWYHFGCPSRYGERIETIKRKKTLNEFFNSSSVVSYDANRSRRKINDSFAGNVAIEDVIKTFL